MKNKRIEHDSMGEIEVDERKLWGAQTQRSLEHFRIGGKCATMPIEVIRALAIVKRSAAKANMQLGVLDPKRGELIVNIADEIRQGALDEHFPLKIWQTGSGTQTNMNLNEVISNKIELIVKGDLTDKERFVHPNDHVNLSQSSNDTFPAAMSIATYLITIEKLIPRIEKLIDTLEKKSIEFQSIIKIGRTHTMDATPLTLGMEFSGYVSQIKETFHTVRLALKDVSYLALGGTAVGTGINAPMGFDTLVAQKVAESTGYPFTTSLNKFEALSSCSSFVKMHSAYKGLAIELFKIANDIRFLGSGPRAGIGELILPANEPGSSIMPGKVNPTQCEALTMVCAQVIGNDSALSIGALSGHFQLNVFRPLIIHNIIESAHLLGDAIQSFITHCLNGLEANTKRISMNVENSLMLVTALSPHIGYEKAAEIAHRAYTDDCSLKEAALKLQYTTEEEYDKWVVPKKMIHPKE